MVDVSQRGDSAAKTPIGICPCQHLVGPGGEEEALSLQVNIYLSHFSKFLIGQLLHKKRRSNQDVVPPDDHRGDIIHLNKHFRNSHELPEKETGLCRNHLPIFVNICYCHRMPKIRCYLQKTRQKVKLLHFIFSLCPYLDNIHYCLRVWGRYDFIMFLKKSLLSSPCIYTIKNTVKTIILILLNIVTI